MFHDTKLAQQAATADPRPKSAVSGGCGLAGLAGLLTWITIARTFGLDGPYSGLVNLAFCAVPMLAWSLIVDKVHLRPSTGIDWQNIKPWRETLDISLTKLAGLWATWGLIATVYALGRFFWQGWYHLLDVVFRDGGTGAVRAVDPVHSLFRSPREAAQGPRLCLRRVADGPAGRQGFARRSSIICAPGA